VHITYIRSIKQLSAILKQARIDRGLTQAELGKMTSMSQKKIAMIENLSASPRLDVLLIIMSALNLNLSIDGKKNKSEQKVSLIWE